MYAGWWKDTNGRWLRACEGATVDEAWKRLARYPMPGMKWVSCVVLPVGMVPWRM